MNWIRNLFGGAQGELDRSHQTLQAKFRAFQNLLSSNNAVLRRMSDMEEKAQGEYLFDLNYIRESLDEIRGGIGDIVECMMVLGGERYEVLRQRYVHIDREIEILLPGGQPLQKDDFTIWFENLDRDRAWSVGSKNAQLGEMKKMGLPVPDGFAVSAWAYKHFMDENRLQARINKRLSHLDVKSFAELIRVSGEIQAMIEESPVPSDLAAEILRFYNELVRRTGSDRVALRSSAIGEDTLYSFAGQYSSYLAVGRDDIVPTYRKVIGSKFAPKAIYYYLSHQLTESQLAMSVGCVSMVDSASAGVLYTRDPVHSYDDRMLINSVWGLGKYLVDGTINPDIFRVSRKDFSIESSIVPRKRVMLVNDPESGAVQRDVPQDMQKAPSIDTDNAKKLAEYGLDIEEHYEAPQDIEWAVDTDGRLFLLQTRPLRVIESDASCEPAEPEALPTLAAGGTTVCPGAGCGPAFQAASSQELAEVPDGAVLIAHHPFPGLITAMGKVNAIVTEVGGVASHMATIAREYRIPTIAGIKGVLDIENGKNVTVDASCGVVYEGEYLELVEKRRPDYDLFEGLDIFDLLKRVMSKISPLNLLHPDDRDFLPENCRTMHDITRYAHQKAMEYMFNAALEIEDNAHIGVALKTDIPLKVNIIYLDKSLSEFSRKEWIEESELDSIPMKHLWSGVMKEGWPKAVDRPEAKPLSTISSRDRISQKRSQFSEESFAVLSREYMLLSLRMGYHFSTIEAMCTPDQQSNYIRMQYKEGGASIDRRMRRVALISDVLGAFGFECDSQRDFLDVSISYQDENAIIEKLTMLGRLIMLTKQLDMVLMNDAIAKWYKQEMMKKLGAGAARNK